nr:hypothetical protein KitaXyl93_35850 [Kitasatospora sp. Xyl93]
MGGAAIGTAHERVRRRQALPPPGTRLRLTSRAPARPPARPPGIPVRPPRNPPPTGPDPPTEGPRPEPSVYGGTVALRQRTHVPGPGWTGPAGAATAAIGRKGARWRRRRRA